jgi:uncharacterized protein (TIGR01244 family)
MEQYKQVNDDVFLGPQPSGKNIEEAKRQGIRTVVDFRLPSETAAPNDELVKSGGLDYVNIPVDRSALSAARIDELEDALGQYPGPYLMHCATGTRAALMVVLLQARQHGWTAERAFDEAERMGFNLRNSEEFANFVRQATSTA